MTPAIVGIDLGKNWFHVVGRSEDGATILRNPAKAYAPRRPTHDHATRRHQKFLPASRRERRSARPLSSIGTSVTV